MPRMGQRGDTKGNGVADVWPDIAGILALGVALFAISVRRFARLAR